MATADDDLLRQRVREYAYNPTQPNPNARAQLESAAPTGPASSKVYPNARAGIEGIPAGSRDIPRAFGAAAPAAPTAPSIDSPTQAAQTAARAPRGPSLFNPENAGRATGDAIKRGASALATSAAENAGAIGGQLLRRGLPVASAAVPFYQDADVLGAQSNLSAGDKAQIAAKDAAKAAGGITGGLYGAGVGGALGSGLGPVGTAVGSLVGGGIGAYGGEKAIDAIGGFARTAANRVNGAFGGDPNYFKDTDALAASARSDIAQRQAQARPLGIGRSAGPGGVPVDHREQAIAQAPQATQPQRPATPTPRATSPRREQAAPSISDAPRQTQQQPEARVPQDGEAGFNGPAAPYYVQPEYQRENPAIAALGGQAVVKSLGAGNDFTANGNPDANIAYRADGTIIKGKEAIDAIAQTNAARTQDYGSRQARAEIDRLTPRTYAPTPGDGTFEQVEFPLTSVQGNRFRDTRVAYTAADADALRKQAATQFAQRDTPYSVTAAGQEPAYQKAAVQGAIDYVNPVAAKTTSQLTQIDAEGKNQARNAGISAGPSYAGVKQRADEAAARLAFDQEQGLKPITVRQGQDVYTDPRTGALVARGLPDRVFDQNTKKYIEDQPQTAPGTLPRTAERDAIKNNVNMSREEKLRALRLLDAK